MRSGLHGASRAFHMLHDMFEIGFKNQFDGAGDVRCTEQRSAQNFQCMRPIVWYLVQLFLVFVVCVKTGFMSCNHH